MALVFNVFLGLTLSITDYSKSLDMSYESLKVESYGFETTYNMSKKYYMQLDFKRISAQVQSSSGYLNIFGWNYTHDFAYLKFGYKLNPSETFYISPMAYYVPTLFPISVGALTSQAAFEKTMSLGLAMGYTKEFVIENFYFKIDTSFAIADFLSKDYAQNYSYLFDVDLNPKWKFSKNMFIGLNYNLISGQSSLIERKTGSDFPIKATYFLHTIFLTFAYTLH